MVIVRPFAVIQFHIFYLLNSQETCKKYLVSMNWTELPVEGIRYIVDKKIVRKEWMFYTLRAGWKLVFGILF